MPEKIPIPSMSTPDVFHGDRKEIMNSEIFAQFPEHTFLENIALDDDGDLFVTSLEEGAVYKIGADKQKVKYAQTTGKLAGILQTGAQSFLLNGWNETGVPTVYLLDEKRQITPLLGLTDAIFLNGMTRLDSKLILICDSYKGCLWQYNLETNEATVWLQHTLLSRTDDADPMPAANGIKIFNATAFVSNTAKRLLIRIPLNGMSAGTPEIFLDRVNLDDFAIATNGTIYATTHIYNSVLKITPEKTITIVGEAEQGLAGSTAVAFGKKAQDRNCIYVTTNGGMSLPLPGGVQAGRVIRISIPNSSS